MKTGAGLSLPEPVSALGVLARVSVAPPGTSLVLGNFEASVFLPHFPCFAES